MNSSVPLHWHCILSIGSSRGWCRAGEPFPVYAVCLVCVMCPMQGGTHQGGNEGEGLWVIVWLLLTLWVKVASFLCLILNLVCYDVFDHCALWSAVSRCVEMCWDVLRCVDGRWNVDLDHNWSLPQHGETCLAAQGEIRPVRCRHTWRQVQLLELSMRIHEMLQ